MSQKDSSDGVDHVRALFRTVIVVVALLALLGAFQGHLTPAVKVNIPGAALMVVGAAVSLCAERLLKGAPEEKRGRARLALRLMGVAACGVGAILIICT